MKKLLIVLITVLLALPSISTAQQGQNAIGLRFGGGIGYGTEISFQTPFSGNRAELDLGFGNRSHYDFWNLTALYQWVMPIESGFYWYYGLGPSIGSWNYDYDRTNGSGVYVAAALNIGVEYNFSEAPLQISIDTRPELSLINPPDDPFGFGLALALRYRF